MSEETNLTKRLINHVIDLKVPKKACFECGSTEILVAENHVVLMEAIEGVLQWDRAHPMGMAICAGCGRTDLYSLAVAGVPMLPKEPEKKPAKKKKRQKYGH